MKRKYKVPLGSVPAELAGGRPVAAGQIVTLDDDAQADPHNKQLIANRRLLPIPDKKHPSEGGDS